MRAVAVAADSEYQRIVRLVEEAARLADGGHQARYVIEKVRRLVESGTVTPREIAG